MERTASTYRPGVSIHEAAVMLGVSPTTVRRWVASGKLRSQRFDRPQGEVVRVFVGPDQIDVPPAVREQVSAPQVSAEAPARTDEQVPTGRDALAAWSTTVLAPLVETIREQAETIGELRMRVTTLEAEKATLDASTAMHAPEPSPQPSRFWWRSWAVYGVVGLLAVVVPVLAWVLLSFPR